MEKRKGKNKNTVVVMLLVRKSISSSIHTHAKYKKRSVVRSVQSGVDADLSLLFLMRIYITCSEIYSQISECS